MGRIKRRKSYFVAFRPSEEVMRQLEALVQAWGENKSRVLVRAVEQAFTRCRKAKNGR